MAFIDEKDKKNQPEQLQPASPVNRPVGSGFMGVKRIIGAGKGGRIGDIITGRLRSAGETARTGLQEAGRLFQKKTGESSQEMETQAEAARGAVSGILGGVDKKAGEVNHIATLAPTQQQQAAFQSIAGGQYKGPSGFENEQELALKTKRAQDLGRLSGTEGGREQLLNQAFAQRGGYGAKQRALDALILGKTAGKQLAETRSGLMGLEGELAEKQTAAAEQVRGLKEKAAGLSGELLGKLELGTKGIGRDVFARKEALEKEQDALYDAVNKALKTGEVEEGDQKTLDVLRQAGLAQGSFIGDLSEADINQFVKKAAAPELKTVITPEELMKINALKTLGGGLAEGKLAPYVSPYTNLKEKEVGTYDPKKGVELPTTGEDKTKSDLQKTLSSRKGTVEKTYNDSFNKFVQANQGISDVQTILKGIGRGGLNSRANQDMMRRLKDLGYEVEAPEGPEGQVWTKNGAPMHPYDILNELKEIKDTQGTIFKSARDTLNKRITIKKKQPQTNSSK